MSEDTLLIGATNRNNFSSYVWICYSVKTSHMVKSDQTIYEIKYI